MSNIIDPTAQQEVPITHEPGFGGVFIDGAKFGVVRDENHVLHCRLDGREAAQRISHYQLVRTLMHKLFQLDPDIDTPIPEHHVQHFIGAGTLQILQYANIEGETYGQLSVEFGSESCERTDRFGFAKPKLPAHRKAIRSALIQWGRRKLGRTIELHLDQTLLSEHQDQRAAFEEAEMQRED